MSALAPALPVYGPDLLPAAIADGSEPTEIPGFLAREEGINYQIRVSEGLSLGLFPDMRESRARVRAWAEGKTVLNTFAYTCGFGLAAVAGGATRALNLDLSRHWLRWGEENYGLNGFKPEARDFVFGDVFDWLNRLSRRGEMFDLVILDPPSFSKTKTGRFSAARDYAQLTELAARVVGPGGRLLACSNLAELPWRAFRERVLAGIAAAARRAEIVGVYREPALDFPAAGEPYLKMALAQLS